MKRFLNKAGYTIIVIALQIVLLGALYKIQSWEPPHIAGTQVDLLLLGLLLTSGGICLVLAAWLMKTEDRLELDPNRVPRSAEKVEELLGGDDQYV
jgi:hypothetical protein